MCIVMGYVSSLVWGPSDLARGPIEVPPPSLCLSFFTDLPVGTRWVQQVGMGGGAPSGDDPLWGCALRPSTSLLLVSTCRPAFLFSAKVGGYGFPRGLAVSAFADSLAKYGGRSDTLTVCAPCTVLVQCRRPLWQLLSCRTT